MTEIEFKRQLKAHEEIIEQFIMLSVVEQQNLKSCILELFAKKNTAFQKQQLTLCGLLSFTLKEYVSNFKKLPEYYFEEKQYQKYRPKWFQDYIGGYLNIMNLKFEVIADLISNYNYAFKDCFIINKLIYLDTRYKIAPKEAFETTVATLLTNYPKFSKEHLYLLFTEEAENYLDDAQSRSGYRDFYIEIDSWVKIIYKVYEAIELDRIKLIKTCLLTPLKDLRLNTRVWFFKLFAKLKPTQKELKRIEKEVFAVYEAKNIELLRTAFLQPSLDVNLLKEFFAPELRYTIDKKIDAKKTVHHSKLPIFKGYTTVEAKCEILQAITTLNKYSKKAYMPISKSVKNEQSAHSKFGGLPYLLQENEYPKCTNCGKHLQLLLQLNLGDVPESTEGELLQLFHCTNLNTNCEAKSVSKGLTTSLCRKVVIKGDSAIKYPNHDNIFPENRIIQFKEFMDYPHQEDYIELGIELQVPDDIYDYMMEHNIGAANANDKLFGYPHWLQSSEYSYNQKLEANAQLVFQLTSKDNLSIEFGDAGIGYLLGNITIENGLLFTWQSC
ncbi:DUF6493 family protein [uncultured Maribacter sp.]|uniref:DUF6493 family protein n=1 Tax=uncultured Maribacter sp. TaxID=431308 RepID=UPI00260BBFF7|nr:DUF6493 family protein [uncultured Maribacter sp.]